MYKDSSHLSFTKSRLVVYSYPAPCSSWKDGHFPKGISHPIRYLGMGWTACVLPLILPVVRRTGSEGTLWLWVAKHSRDDSLIIIIWCSRCRPCFHAPDQSVKSLRQQLRGCWRCKTASAADSKTHPHCSSYSAWISMRIPHLTLQTNQKCVPPSQS